MFSRSSPLKRKHSEFRDPDYPQQEQLKENDDDFPSCSTNFVNKRSKSGDGAQTAKDSKDENYLIKVRQIIEKEFQREIVMKQQQLEEITNRIEKAKHLLARLRFGIVSEYYKKQEIPLTSADIGALRGAHCLFEREEKGPQMPLHPSVKKLIGKRPKDLSEVMRACPKRAAAQNAVHTIRAKSEAQKREQRKLKKIIKNEGIVIDHSKQNVTENNVNAMLNAAVENSMKGFQDTTTSAVFKKETDKTPSGKSLNVARLNNKIKYLIVVGNTSKYIGNELDRETKLHTQNITHKWLVYVQSKEAKNPIETFIKKVRFYLHRSYRPNEIVDIESPPFQISRRGWGEFPLRVQLFFHAEYHQKPVQLMHNIILDKTLSGIQTLGAETLLEIWLRDIKSSCNSNSEVKDTKPKVDTASEVCEAKPDSNILARAEDLVDENLLDFLNKIEASPCSISADIEKIQPTVIVNEPLAVKIKNPSPLKSRVLTPTYQKSPIKMKQLLETKEIPELRLTINSNLESDLIDSLPQKSITNTSASTKPMTGFVKKNPPESQVKSIHSTTPGEKTISQIPPLCPITPASTYATKSNQTLSSATQKTPLALSKDGKIIMPSASVASAVHKTILPIAGISSPTSQMSQISTTNQTNIKSIPKSSITFNKPKQILQKKLVQLIDSSGKVKYIQMLVAASSASSTVPIISTATISPKIITLASSLANNNTVTKTTNITKTVPTPLLRSQNGIHLVPAITTKTNIFKIVPENMQTKPQVVTFSSTNVGPTYTNACATASNQQELLNLTTKTTSTTHSVGNVVASPPVMANNVKIPAASKSQKSSSNSATLPIKNVFQKEGKVYIIDPQQMKYKQQQKTQVSLLKPQISLLKQQQQKLTTSPTIISKSNLDTSSKSSVAMQLSKNKSISEINFGLQQQRTSTMNSLQLMHMKRMLFEKKFLRQEFTSIRAAVEYLLRSLKLVVPKDSLVADFPFVSHNFQEFQALTAFKQRAREWLRAKNVSRLLRNHKELQRLNSSSQELFWSTKEIAIFARQYAYTPPIKSLPKSDDNQQMGDKNNKFFTDLVRSELRQEHNLDFDTLTDQCEVRKWIDNTVNALTDYEREEEQHEIIDIDSMKEEDCKKNKKVKPVCNSACVSGSSFATYLTPPRHLENECQLVSDICKNLNIKLAHEELETNIHYPLTQTVLAQCLHSFIEKLLRESIALTHRKLPVSSALNEFTSTLTPHDFAKVLASNSEFDFLTNNNFGSAALTATSQPNIKEEQL